MSRIGEYLLGSRYVLLFTLLAISVTFWFAEQSVYRLAFGWHYAVAALLVGWYLCLLLRDKQSAALTSFYQVFYGVGMLASAGIIASGAEMIEVSATGTPNGVFWLMLFFFVIGLEATVLGYRCGSAVKLPMPALRLPQVIDSLIMLAMILPVLLLSFYVLFATGGPLLLGLNRVTFWQTAAPPGTSILRSVVPQTFFFVAFIYLNQTQHFASITLGKLLVVAYILIGLLVLGEKLSLFIILINIWLLVFPGSGRRVKINFKLFLFGGAISSALLSIVAMSYLSDGRELGFILTRVALQAQLLWSAANSAMSAVGSEFRPNCYFGCDSFANGMDYISHLYLPLGTYEFYKQSGTILSGFMPALPMVTFGLGIAFILHIIVCFVSGVLQKKLVVAIEKGQPVYGFLLFKLQFSLTLTWFAAMQTGGPGLVAVILAIVLYRAAGFVGVGRLSANIGVRRT